MGYRGKLAERERARELRAQSWTLLDIAHELGVAKSSVSLWVRDVAFTPSPRRYGARTRPNRLQVQKKREIEECQHLGAERVGELSERDRFIAGLALYAGEGAKRDGDVALANTNPDIVRFFCRWLREFYEIKESGFRIFLYLHEGLDLQAATNFWSELCDIPESQFGKPYRAKAGASIRSNKHVFGCVRVRNYSKRVHRLIMGSIDALLISDHLPG